MTLLPAALGQRANHDIQRNIVTAHNDKIGCALGFPDQRDFNLTVGIERGGERVDGKESVGLRERCHRPRTFSCWKSDKAFVRTDKRNQYEFFAAELGRDAQRHARSDRVRRFEG